MKKIIITAIISTIITATITTMITTYNKPTEKEQKYTETLTTEAIAKYNTITEHWEIEVINKAFANNVEYNNQIHHYTIDSNEVCDDRIISKCVIDSYGYYTEDNYEVEWISSVVNVAE
jgi:hypothetical protein